MATEFGEKPNEIDLIPRSWGGWLAVAQDRPLAATGATASEARLRLEDVIARFDDWAEHAAREQATPTEGIESLPVAGEGGRDPVTPDMKSTEIDPLGFEQAAHTNGGTCWYAREYGAFLGYADYNQFHKGPIERAITASMRAGIPVVENFRESVTIVDGKEVRDMELSRFGCFLVAMNADSKKTQVARVQAYLAGLAETLGEYLKSPEQLERIIVRGEISDGEKSLASTAKAAGVTMYAFFQNAGYRGMYNVNLGQLRIIKGVPSNRSPLDFMASTELAANLFRITQTDAKIQNEGITGQARLEIAATDVGREVRKTMIKLSNTLPENLPPASDIRDVHASLKQTHRSLNKLDRTRQLGPGKSKRTK